MKKILLIFALFSPVPFFCMEQGIDLKTKLNNRLFAAIEDDKSDPKYIKTLLDLGADPNALDRYGFTSLYNAVFRPEITSILLQYKANPNIGNKALKKTPLFDSPFETTKLLLSSGAYTNSKNKFKETPLHSKAEKNEPDNILLLLQNGAIVSIQDCEGRTPLHNAANSNNEEIVKYLLLFAPNHQKLIKVKNDENKTAFDLATDQKIKKILSDEETLKKEIDELRRKLIGKDVTRYLLKREIG